MGRKWGGWSGLGIWSSEMDQRVKVRIGNREVIEMKQGSLEMKMGRGEVRIGVLVWGCTECNTILI